MKPIKQIAGKIYRTLAAELESQTHKQIPRTLSVQISDRVNNGSAKLLYQELIQLSIDELMKDLEGVEDVDANEKLVKGLKDEIHGQ